MSVSHTGATLSRVSRTITYALVLGSIVGCHHRSGSPAPSPRETVKVGYGERSRDQIGGAVQSATFEDARTVKASRVEELLVGRFPGVRVARTANGGYSVRIRGASSFISNEEPLYVIDGMLVEVTAGHGLNWLNPADVARIDLLTNPAETTMYGVRGANGVIVITTKRSR